MSFLIPIFFMIWEIMHVINSPMMTSNIAFVGHTAAHDTPICKNQGMEENSQNNQGKSPNTSGIITIILTQATPLPHPPQMDVYSFDNVTN